MGDHVVSHSVNLMIKKGITGNNANLLVLEVTFKENCPDVRNTKIVDVVIALKDYGIQITVYDFWAKPKEVMYEYNLETASNLPVGRFDVVVLGVVYNIFRLRFLFFAK